MSRVKQVPNLRTVKALRGQALKIDMGRTLPGTLTAWMKKKPTDATFRSFQIIDNRYLFLTKQKASDYYDTTTELLVEAIKGKWYFDIRMTPTGGTVDQEEIIYTGVILFEDHITDSNGQELVNPSSTPFVSTFIHLTDTPNNYGTVGQVPAMNAAGTALEFVSISTLDGSDKHYTHDQGISSDTWTINHGLGKYPSVVAVDSAKSAVVGAIDYIDTNNLTITFNAAFSGEAYLN
tara:strand:- start:3852 stop:4556 length:705 start_codon:yes stop_codon:yes gene_type:complete